MSSKSTSTAAEFLPTRESLLGRLRDWEDQESWREFYNTYWRLIYSFARKSGLTDSEAADVLQETVLSVARSMKDFQYERQGGSFKRWLLQLTRWRIADQFKKRPALRAELKDEEGKTRLMERIADPASLEPPSTLWDEEWQQNLLAVATERLKEKVSPKQFQIFQLYALEGWPVAKVVKALGVSHALVYVTKHRLAALLKKEVERLTRNATRAPEIR